MLKNAAKCVEKIGFDTAENEPDKKYANFCNILPNIVTRGQFKYLAQFRNREGPRGRILSGHDGDRALQQRGLRHRQLASCAGRSRSVRKTGSKIKTRLSLCTDLPAR